MDEPLTFDCRLYVSALGPISPVLPQLSGPRKSIALKPIEYDKLIDPNFRHLIEAFETLPQPLRVVQV